MINSIQKFYFTNQRDFLFLTIDCIYQAHYPYDKHENCPNPTDYRNNAREESQINNKRLIKMEFSTFLITYHINYQPYDYTDITQNSSRLSCELNYGDHTETFEADESFRTHPSPILFDDERCGEIYDARLEIPGWSEPDFDDSTWRAAIRADTPRGETRIYSAEPIVVDRAVAPVKIGPGKVSLWPSPRPNLPVYPVPEDEPKEGYLYDFGINSAGNVRLKIRGQRGQKVILRFGELLAPHLVTPDASRHLHQGSSGSLPSSSPWCAQGSSGFRW